VIALGVNPRLVKSETCHRAAPVHEHASRGNSSDDCHVIRVVAAMKPAINSISSPLRRWGSRAASITD
jgi:hypothetical protein